jgi:mannan endo-1,6-alpha-mannosidase
MRSLTISALSVGATLAAIKVDPNNSSMTKSCFTSHNMFLFSNVQLDTIKDAAKSVAKNLISYYHGNERGEAPGVLPGPPPDGEYYWWEAGVMWNTLIDYWHYTGDATYNDIVTQGIHFQIGPNNNFMPPNYTNQIGNEEQGLWAMAAITAVETDLKSPSDEADSQWLAVVENVFSNQAVERWNGSSEDCGGGLRWQIFMFNQGYDYKNSLSTGVLFNIAARLSRFTQNNTYADWAEKTWSWMESVGFLDNGAIYDGANVQGNCSDINQKQFSHTAGVFIQGAAYMYNYTKGSETWKSRLTSVLNNTVSTFFNDKGVPVEADCESRQSCTTDMMAFKGVLLRSLASTAQLAPFTGSIYGPLLESSALAAAGSCNDAGGDKGAECGFVWTGGEDDGSYGVGQQLNALSALSVMFADQASGPGANNTSGGGGGGGGGSPTQSGSPTTTPTAPGKNAAQRTGVEHWVNSVLLAFVFSVLLA